MNMGFVNVAIAKKDRIPIHASTTARLLENHEVAIKTTRAEKRTEAQNPCNLTGQGACAPFG